MDSKENCNKMLKDFKINNRLNPYKEEDSRLCSIREQMNKKSENENTSLLQKAEAKKTGIERQLEDSKRSLQELIFFGYELVSNIKIANEKREMLRTQHELVKIEELKEDLRKESAESQEQFSDVTSKWTELKTMKEPIELYEKIESQKERISEIINKKDELIQHCQEEINRISDIYCSDQEKQSNDVNCLVERIDNQIELLKSSYNEQFGLLHNTIEDERTNIKLLASTKWNSLYDEMLANESEKFKIVKEKEIFYSREIDRICAEQEEITRASRIRLEKDAEILQWELLNTKKIVLMTSEKLDYNYQVLQKRNEENVIINNQQKRRVARLNESISSVKKRILETTNNTEITINKLTGDIQKLHLSISDLEKKSQQFSRNNEEKYNNICRINIEEIQRILRKVFEIDRVLYQQHLAIPWPEPKVSFGNIDSSTEKTSMEKIEKKPSEEETSFEKKIIYSRLLRNILRKISDRTGFLIEEKLLQILKPFAEDEKCIVRLDNIFNALRITEMKSVSQLTEFFEPYSWCPNCSKQILTEDLENLFKVDNDLTNTSPTSKPTNDDVGMEELKVPNNEFCENHYLVIEPALVLTALKQFTKKHSFTKTFKKPKALMQTTGIEITSSNDIKDIWSTWLSCVPVEKEKLWMSLEHGLTHYLNLLKQRHKLDTDCKFLRKQNNEFLHMFQQLSL